MMIRSNDAEVSQVASQIFAAHKENLQDFQQPSVQCSINEMKHYETKDLVAPSGPLHSCDGCGSKRHGSCSSLCTDADNPNLDSFTEGQICGEKPQDLHGTLNFGHQTTQETVWYKETGIGS